MPDFSFFGRLPIYAVLWLRRLLRSLQSCHAQWQRVVLLALSVVKGFCWVCLFVFLFFLPRTTFVLVLSLGILCPGGFSSWAWLLHYADICRLLKLWCLPVPSNNPPWYCSSPCLIFFAPRTFSRPPFCSRGWGAVFCHGHFIWVSAFSCF